MLTNEVAVTRQLLRKLLIDSRVTFYPQADGPSRWYEIGITPSFNKFFGAVPTLKKALASPTGSLDMYCEVPLVGTVQLAA